jgi:uncharacterized caspase-like protein
MRNRGDFPKAGLCLWLSLCLGFPAGVWAQGKSRDLQVEELKYRAALWVLAIGVSQYADSRLNLQYADYDAQKIAQALQTQQGRLFREVYTQVLANERATREEILKAMSTFLGQASQEDVVVIFLAGHGLQDRQTGTYYFVPHDAQADNLVYAGLPMPMFEEACKRIRANVSKLVLWLDTCHAGAMSVAARGVNAGEDLATALAQAEGQYMLSASKAGEESYEEAQYRFEGESKGHGAFTYSLLRGLQGAASDSSGVVWVSDLFSHVSKEVPRLTTGRQHPHGQISGTNLPLFVVDAAGLQAVGQAAIAPLPPTLGTMALRKKGSRKWMWVLLGVAATGAGSAVLLRPSKSAGEPTGGITVVVQVP